MTLIQTFSCLSFEKKKRLNFYFKFLWPRLESLTEGLLPRYLDTKTTKMF